MSKRPRPYYGSTDFEMEVDDMLEHIGNQEDAHIRAAIATLYALLEDVTPVLTDSDARQIAALPSIDRDRFLADLKRETLMIGGVWP